MYNKQCDYFCINDDVAECLLKGKIIPSDCDKCRKEDEDGKDAE